MGKKTVAELFIDTLVLAGVRRMYGVAGDSLNSLRSQQPREAPLG